MDSILVATSVLALVSTSGALTTSLLSLKRDLTRAPAAHYSLLREVAVLRDIVDECTHTLDGLSQVPVHIRQTLISCFEAGEKVHTLLEMRKFVSPRVGAADFPGWLLAFKLYTYSREKDLAGEVSQFRERVYLLRDMCSEIKTGSQLFEASAAIFKLMSLTEHESHLTRAELETLRKRMSERDQNGWTDHDDDITHGGGLSRSNSESEFEALNAAQKPSEATETNETNGILLRNRRQPLAEQVMALVKSNYIVDATVLVENSTKHGGRRFNQAPANVQYYPGRVKLDTGSEADLASLQYLLDAGLNKDDLTPIPVANQCQVEGIGGALFTPKFEVELRWFRHGEPRTNKDRFLVVDQAPFDLLLSSRRFAQEARLTSLPLMRRRKPREEIAKELKEEKKRIEAANALEEQEYQQERVRRMEMGRVSTIHTTHNDNIV